MTVGGFMPSVSMAGPPGSRHFTAQGERQPFLHCDPEGPELPPTVDAFPSPLLLRGSSDPKNGDLPGLELPFPDAGTTFLGFDLVKQIGQGAFARVFLARQQELGNRSVALKLTTESSGESHVLAQLLHTNIVPIYSVHKDGPFHAVCMPFLGTTTLADVVRNLRSRALPDSGRYLVQTLQEQRSSHHSALYGSDQHRLPAALADQPLETTPNGDIGEPGTQIILDKLQGLSYVDAVLWLACQLTDGLAHAHERGIVHRDLKPANVLLTDEGQPMLLDFNLARDTKRQEAEGARLGGTLPYMSPEQLRALDEGASSTLDTRSDLYSFGVILYELLTGHFPFPSRSGPTREVVQHMFRDRQHASPSLRRWNRSVTPALEAIVRRCLEPDPAKRYQTARDLEEDLHRQRDHLPLRHVAEPSWRERMSKWARRHPRLTSLSTMSGLALGLVVILAVCLDSASARLRRFEAAEHLQRFEHDLRAAQFLLTSPSADADEAEQVLQLGRRALDRLAIVDDSTWRQRPEFTHLPVPQQCRLESGTQGLLLMLARARAVQAVDLPAGTEQAAGLRRALHFNERAEKEGAAQNLPHALWGQRAQLLALLGDQAQAKQFRDKAAAADPKNSQDSYLAARDLVARGRWRDALPLLENATRDDPQSLPAWFLLGRCRDGLSQDKEAGACFTTCIALDPKAARAYFHRGLAELRLKDYAPAEADFSRVLELEPKNADAFLNRALARHGLDRTREAIADLDQGLALKTPHTRVFFMRARLRERAGDRDGAKSDRDEGLKRQPADDLSWAARGFARLPADPKGALSDFCKALDVNPRSLPALVNAAHVLSENLGQTAEAIRHLDRAVELFPDYVPARVGRGILFARLGRRDLAHKDAADSLGRTADPATVFRAARIYSLTSKKVPADRNEALRLLKSALKQGHGFDLLETSPDLSPLREVREFRRLVDAAGALQ